MWLNIATGSYHSLYIGLRIDFYGGFKSCWKPGGQYDRLTSGIASAMRDGWCAKTTS